MLFFTKDQHGLICIGGVRALYRSLQWRAGNASFFLQLEYSMESSLKKYEKVAQEYPLLSMRTEEHFQNIWREEYRTAMQYLRTAVNSGVKEMVIAVMVERGLMMLEGSVHQSIRLYGALSALRFTEFRPSRFFEVRACVLLAYAGEPPAAVQRRIERLERLIWREPTTVIH